MKIICRTLLTCLLFLSSCSNIDKRNATEVIPASQSSTQITEEKYEYKVVNLKDRANAKEGKVFYLINRGNGDWKISFDNENIIEPEVERLIFWNDSNEVAFKFDDDFGACDTGADNRSKYGYRICSSKFKTNGGTMTLGAVRAFAAVVSLGMTEADLAIKGRKFYKVDDKAILSLLTKLHLKANFREYNYNNDYANARSYNDYMVFVERYKGDDPKRYVDILKTKAEKIRFHSEAYTKVASGIQNLEYYKSKSMPKNPQGYCNDLKRDKESFSICREMVVSYIDELAIERAKTKRNKDLCIGVAKVIGVIGASCDSINQNGTCSSIKNGESNLCEVLSMKGNY